MNVKQYTAIFLFGALTATASWYLVLNSIDPLQGGTPAIVLFYATFGLMIFGWLITILTVFRTIIRVKTSLEHSIRVSIRQSAMLTVGVLLASGLQHLGGLNILSIILIVIALATVEFFLYEIDEQEKK